MLTLITGGARSGKSHYAEQLAHDAGDGVLFVATAQAFDDEMTARIERHRQDRPPDWNTAESPTNIAATIAPILTAAPQTIIIDCLTLLVSNQLIALDPLTEACANAAVNSELDPLFALITVHPAHRWVIVTNEVGLGIVPVNHLARIYRDELGRANQRLAAAADRVLFLVAGIPMSVK